MPITSAPPVRRRLFSALGALTILLAACSGSDTVSENLVPVDAPAPGVVYVSTAAGDLQVVTPATGAVSVVTTAAEQNAILDLAPAGNGTSAYGLEQIPAATFATGIVDISAQGLATIETASDGLSCLDPHVASATPLAHEVIASAVNGAEFTAVPFDGGEVAAGADLVSVACPRWTADRQTVATAIPTRDGDPSSIVTVVQTESGDRHEIGFTQCGTTPTSFSPDDTLLVVSLTCYSASWDNSGLYMVPVADLADVSDLDALTRLGKGLYGRTAWHPDGDWIAAAHADPIERQNIAQDLGAQPVNLQAIEVATGQIVDLELAGGAQPFSVAWLTAALS